MRQDALSAVTLGLMQSTLRDATAAMVKASWPLTFLNSLAGQTHELIDMLLLL